MEMEIQQKINLEQSHRMAMQKAKADAALTMTIYQKHVEKTRNQTVEAKTIMKQKRNLRTRNTCAKKRKP